MTIYKYHALNKKGKNINGVVEAENERNARDKIRQQDLMIIKITPQNLSCPPIKNEHLVNFTTQLAQMLSSNIPLYESLKILEEQYQKEKYHGILVALSENIKKGLSLSEAMSHFRKSFDGLYLGMVAAGESIGSLPETLKKLSELLSNKIKLKKQISTALIYPSIVMCFAFIAIFVLMTFVVPSIETIFDKNQVAPFTRTIINISHNLNSFWHIYLLIIVLGFTSLIMIYKKSSTKPKIDLLMLRIPIIKNIISAAAMARFANTMATTQQGGMTIVDSLSLASKVAKNKIIEKELSLIKEKIISGGTISSELKKSPWIPSMVTKMIAVGEETGNTAIMFKKVAEIYDSELERKLTRITAVITPAILVVTGLIVGLVMLAILLPLTDISAFSM